MNLFKLSRDDSVHSQRRDQLLNDSERLKVIFDSIDDGIILIDNQATVSLINPGASTICGWKADDAAGINVKAVIQLVDDKGEVIPDSQNPLDNVFRRAEAIKNNGLFLKSKDNRILPISLTMSPLSDENKEVYAAIAVFRNVSSERAEEQQRADFISTASHEMRTPVAAIEGYLALALNDKVATIDSRARGYLEKAHASTKHLGQLFQDLLTSAKAEDGRLSSHPKVIEMGEFLEQLANDFKLVAEKKGLYMELVTGSSDRTINATHTSGGERIIRPLYYAHVDPGRLREVITNLFDNAVKYTDQGKITIGLSGNTDIIQMYVRDSGAGIPADDIPHLFQKFYRVDNSATRSVGGTGLGLFISRKIVELYNGRIWVESTLGEGSTFYINLPRLSSDQAKALKEKEASESILPAV